jgi:CubicO group peptidase (beta-lactamase class C family)
MKSSVRLAGALLLSCAAASFAQSPLARATTQQTTIRQPIDTFPGKTWLTATPEELGWSRANLDEARKFFDTLPPASLFVVDHGRVIVDWGDSTRKIKISSMRKSLLSALYGIDSANGRFDLDKTLEQLGIDDDPPLAASEKKATVRMLLESKSGVYHSYVAGTPQMRETMPARGSHAPGTFWYYNNWDFNALGSIFEQQLHTSIGAEFRDKIALPTQMQDFLVDDVYYQRAEPDSPAYQKSRYPAYQFRLTARDLARLGLLMLQKGDWSGSQVIPAGWVEESTHAYTTDAGRDGSGYGYLWWVNGFGLPEKSFSGRGAFAKYLVVIPERDLVIVYLNHVEFPDNGATMSEAELAKLPSISSSQMGHLLELLLRAQRSIKLDNQNH